jgi:glycolate oxidase iron-sulfur subunit
MERLPQPARSGIAIVTQDRQQRLLSLADRCVKCALCLPHCPTYRQSGDESEGPRGRIALIQGLALRALEPTAQLQGHLDRCLGCRACEAMCPAQVQFGELMDLAREELTSAAKPASRLQRLGFRIVRRRALRRGVAWVIYLYRRTGLQRLTRRSGVLRLLGLARLEGYVARTPRPQALRPHYPAQGARRGRVALFTGCLGESFEQGTLGAAIEVLTRLRFEVVIPPAQSCCGALFLHAGEKARAQQLAARNLAAFAGADIDAILYTASGCGAQLGEYERLTNDATSAFVGRLRELSAFLAELDWEGLPIEPLAARAAVHDPCSLRNVCGGVEAPYRLLARIPRLAVEPLAGNHSCCGAAGTYMLSEPAMADALRAPKLLAAEAAAPDFLLTSNIGCALHLAAGLRERNPALEVLHPVALLARQLRTPSVPCQKFAAFLRP